MLVCILSSPLRARVGLCDKEEAAIITIIVTSKYIYNQHIDYDPYFEADQHSI